MCVARVWNYRWPSDTDAAGHADLRVHLHGDLTYLNTQADVVNNKASLRAIPRKSLLDLIKFLYSRMTENEWL